MLGELIPASRAAPMLRASRPAEGGELETFLFEGGLQLGYWRLSVSRYYLRLVAGLARVVRNVDTAAATPLAPTPSVTGVKSSSTNSIPTFGPHQRKTHGYKSGLLGYAYPSGISR